MPTYDVPEVGRVTVTFSTHPFGNSGQTLKSLDDVYDETGEQVPYPVWEKVNSYLRERKVVH